MVEGLRTMMQDYVGKVNCTSTRTYIRLNARTREINTRYPIFDVRHSMCMSLDCFAAPRCAKTRV